MAIIHMYSTSGYLFIYKSRYMYILRASSKIPRQYTYKHVVYCTSKYLSPNKYIHVA